MSTHLTREQIDGWLIGEQTAESAKHVADCPECAAAVARAEAPLAAFRTAMHGWSERRMSRDAVVAPRRSSWRWAGLTVATAALGLMIAGGVDLRHRQVASERAAARADDALLEQVDADVARSVPAPLEPLADLMTAASQTQEGTAQ